MPAYDFLSGVASAVEKQSNALQAYGLQKREQEREQQERTQYNQVSTELGQFLASGQEIPEERIQTWTSMMGAAPPEIVTAFTNAMNTLGNRREEQQYRTVQTGIPQEGLNLQRQQLRQRIRDRDGNCCKVCGVSGETLSVHHIDYIKENLDATNLISLCAKCHGSMHPRDLKKREVLKMWLSSLLGF